MSASGVRMEGSRGVKPRGSVALMDAHRLSDAGDADFYPTPPWGARAGGELIRALDPAGRTCWEPACGAGHLALGLGEYFDQVVTSDLLGYGGGALFDFCQPGPAPVQADWIVTNPPFNRAAEFITLGRQRARRGLALLMRAGGLESIGRHRLVYGDPVTGEGCAAAFAPFVERLPMHKGRWEPEGVTAAFYGWFIWFAPGVGFEPPVVLGKRRPVTIDIPPGSCARLTRPDDAARMGVR